MTTTLEQMQLRQMKARQAAGREAASQAPAPELSQAALDSVAAADQIAEDRMALAGENPVTMRAAVATSGLPFIGEWIDEAIGLVSPEAQERLRSKLDAFARENPTEAAALRLTGGVVGSLPAIAAAPAAAAAAPASIGGRVATGAVIGAVAGGVEGAASGAGRGRNNAERRQMALTDGAIGAGLGLGLGAAAPLVAETVTALGRARNSDVKTIAEQFGVSPATARVVRDALDADDMDRAAEALRKAGDDAMLADAGEATGELLDAAIASGGAATRVGRNAVSRRAADMQSRVVRALDDILGPPDGIRAASRDIARRSAGARQAAYAKAYETPIDYAAASGRAIEDVLARVDDRTLRRAIQEANDAMQAEGVRNAQIMAQIADDGSVTFAEMPNVRQLDEIKKALQAIAQGETDAITGRVSSAGRRASLLARDLRDAVQEAVPAYRTAVRLGGDKIAEDAALDLGRNLLAPRVTREAVQEVMGSAAADTRDAFRRGLRQAIDELMARTRGTALQNETEAREVLKALNALSDRATREKIRIALPNDYQQVLNAVRQAEQAIALRARTARGSQTAIRTAIQSSVADASSPGVVGEVARGQLVPGAQRIVQVLTNTTKEADAARTSAIMEEIATALTQIRGRRADQALAAVRRAMDGQPMVDEQARRIANLVAGSVSLGGHQSASQLIGPQ